MVKLVAIAVVDLHLDQGVVRFIPMTAVTNVGTEDIMLGIVKNTDEEDAVIGKIIVFFFVKSLVLNYFLF